MKIPSIFSKLISEYFRWTAIAIAVLILALGYWTLLAVKIETIQTTSLTERSRLQQEVKTEEQNLENTRTTVANFRRTLSVDKLKAIDQFIPSSPDFPGLLLIMDNVAKTAGLELVSLNLGQAGIKTAAATATTTPTTGAIAQAATISGTSLQTQDLSVQFTGGKSYGDFKALLQLIESSQRLFDVISYGFDHQTTEGVESGNYRFEVRTYYLSP